MKHTAKPKAILLIDGPDPDNYVALMTAISAFTCYELVAVIMAGRPVSPNKDDAPYVFNAHASRAVQRDNAMHAKGIVVRYGHGHIPVFTGGFAPWTTVPHRVHVHERVTDIYDDAHAGHVLAGDIQDAIVYLAQFSEPIHVICGGPLTDLVPLITHPMLSDKLGVVTAQLGMFGFNPDVQMYAGGTKQFNVATDALAAWLSMRLLTKPAYLVSSDTTKHGKLGFQGPREIARLSSSKACAEASRMYEGAWPYVWGAQGIDAHLHDFHPAELMHHVLRGDPLRHVGMAAGKLAQVGPYAIESVGISHVPHRPEERDHWGEMHLGPIDPLLPRLLVKDYDYPSHRSILGEVFDLVGS